MLRSPPQGGWATPCLLASPLCKMLLWPPSRCSGSVCGQGAGPSPPGASGRSPRTPRSRQPSPPSTWASYTLLAPVRTTRTHNSPGGRCPTRWAPQATTLPLLHLPRLCRGKGLSLKHAPSPLPGPPPGKGAFGQPQDLAAATPAHRTSCPPRKGCVCRGCQTNNTLLPSETATPSQLRGKGQRTGLFFSPLTFLGWGWCLWGYRSQVPSSTAPKGTGRPSSLYPPLPHVGYPPTPSLAEVKRGPYPESPASQPGPLGTGEVWAKAVGVSGRKRAEALRRGLCRTPLTPWPPEV